MVAETNKTQKKTSEKEEKKISARTLKKYWILSVHIIIEYTTLFTTVRLLWPISNHRLNGSSSPMLTASGGARA